MDFTKNTNLSIEKISENKTSGTELSANKVLRDFISWNKEAIDNTFS